MLRDSETMQHLLTNLDGVDLHLEYLIKNQIGVLPLPFTGMDSKFTNRSHSRAGFGIETNLFRLAYFIFIVRFNARVQLGLSLDLSAGRVQTSSCRNNKAVDNIMSESSNISEVRNNWSTVF